MNFNRIYPILFIALSIQVEAQKSGDLKLQEALKLTETNYPSILARTHELNAAKSNVNLQKYDWLPRLDVNLQLSTSSLNNIYGLSYPQDIVLPISGPVKLENNYKAIWGSAGGLLLSWQPLMFGERRARIKLASIELKAAGNDLMNEIFDHEINLIDTWLDFLASRALIQSQVSNLERTLSIYQSTKILSGKGLKPVVDSLIAAVEVSKAREGFNKSKESMIVLKYRIAEQLALNDTSFIIPAQNFLNDMPILDDYAKDSTSGNPRLQLIQSRMEEAESGLQLAKHLYHPKLSIYESSFARGSGADINGNNDYSISGINFTKYNYAVGLTFTFPILQMFPDKYHIRIQQEKLMAQKSLLDEEELKIQNNFQISRVHIHTAILNYYESRLRFQSANASYIEMKVRYASGLLSLPELFQIQYELSRAESENSIALLNVWKAYLYYVQASGDINLFLNQVK